MVKILMMSAKMATPALLEKRYFEINVITSYVLSVTSAKKFCRMTQITLWMWLFDHSFVTLAFV